MTTYLVREHCDVQLNLLLIDVSLFEIHSSEAID